MGDWGFSAKDFVYGGSAILALITSFKRIWVWRAELDACEARHMASQVQLRADLGAVIEDVKQERDIYRKAVFELRDVNKLSIETVAKLTSKAA